MALVEHDVVIGDNVHVATGARINGNVTIGSNCFVGSGTIITRCDYRKKYRYFGRSIRTEQLAGKYSFWVHDEQ